MSESPHDWIPVEQVLLSNILGGVVAIGGVMMGSFILDFPYSVSASPSDVQILLFTLVFFGAWFLLILTWLLSLPALRSRRKGNGALGVLLSSGVGMFIDRVVFGSNDWVYTYIGAIVGLFFAFHWWRWMKASSQW